MENWASTLLQTINQKVKEYNYTDLQIKTLEISFLTNLLTHISQKENLLKDTVLEENFNTIIAVLPNTNNFKFSPKNYTKQFAFFKKYISDTYKFVTKNYYRSVFLPIGMSIGLPLGLPFGAFMGNIASGLPFGMPIGMAIGAFYGNYLDKKAEKEQRAF